jgi:branched-subunit amino acid ABC-type transport system permease component
MRLDHLANLALGIVGNVGLLVVASLGLAVIFGMMGVINFAHGAFLMLGAFGTLTGVKAGLPLAAAMLCAALAVGAVGLVVERVMIRRLYGRPEATMLATFGLSLILTQLAVVIWGTDSQSIETPLSRFQVGRYAVAEYPLVVAAAGVVMSFIVYVVFTRTSFGITARAVADRPAIAASLGVRAGRVNMVTFAVGATLAGAGGALIAPIGAISPTFGGAYIVQAFMTVAVGGGAVVTGTAASAGLLGSVSRVTEELTSPLVGVAALLIVAIVLLRVRPAGLAAKWRRAL